MTIQNHQNDQRDHTPGRADPGAAPTATSTVKPATAHDREEAGGERVAPSLANDLTGRCHADTGAGGPDRQRAAVRGALLTHPRCGAIPTAEDAVITPTDLGKIDARQSGDAEELMAAGGAVTAAAARELAEPVYGDLLAAAAEDLIKNGLCIEQFCEAFGVSVDQLLPITNREASRVEDLECVQEWLSARFDEVAAMAGTP